METGATVFTGGNIRSKESRKRSFQHQTSTEWSLNVVGKTVVNSEARTRIREFFNRVTQEKGNLSLAMLVQSSPGLPDRWSLLVSAPWIDSLGVRSAVAYLSSGLKHYASKEVLSVIDRISALPSDDARVQRLLDNVHDFLDLGVTSPPDGFPLRNWAIDDWEIPQAFVFVADPDARLKSSKAGKRTTNHRTVVG